MTNRSAFTDDEWQVLLRAPTFAGTFISYADANFFDLIREGRTLYRILTVESLGEPQEELIRELHDALRDIGKTSHQLPGHDEANTWRPKAIKPILLDKIGAAVKLVDQKATRSEAGAFRSWLQAIARSTAEAGKEKYFGLGGARVSSAEDEALAALSSRLGNYQGT